METCILKAVSSQEENATFITIIDSFFGCTKRKSKELWSTHWTCGLSRFRNLVQKR